jgi:KDO2-lipid IV(A) lauroyltransferase
MAAIEAMARRAPEQYLWIHRRFKRQPDGQSPY